jgi:hypothetical protein
MALGSTTTANSLYQVISVLRQQHGARESGPNPNRKAVSSGTNYHCLVLGVTMGGMATAYMQGSWDESD